MMIKFINTLFVFLVAAIVFIVTTVSGLAAGVIGDFLRLFKKEAVSASSDNTPSGPSRKIPVAPAGMTLARNRVAGRR